MLIFNLDVVPFIRQSIGECYVKSLRFVFYLVEETEDEVAA